VQPAHESRSQHPVMQGRQHTVKSNHSKQQHRIVVGASSRERKESVVWRLVVAASPASMTASLPPPPFSNCLRSQVPLTHLWSRNLGRGAAAGSASAAAFAGGAALTAEPLEAAGGDGSATLGVGRRLPGRGAGTRGGGGAGLQRFEGVGSGCGPPYDGC
jgi:hypothetical protein